MALLEWLIRTYTDEGATVPSTITTLQGDTWDILTCRAYGNEHLMNVLLAANPDCVDVEVFSSGTRVAAPDVQEPAESDLHFKIRSGI